MLSKSRKRGNYIQGRLYEYRSTASKNVVLRSCTIYVNKDQEWKRDNEVQWKEPEEKSEKLEFFLFNYFLIVATWVSLFAY